jgi:hypothetical protein
MIATCNEQDLLLFEPQHDREVLNQALADGFYKLPPKQPADTLP